MKSAKDEYFQLPLQASEYVHSSLRELLQARDFVKNIFPSHTYVVLVKWKQWQHYVAGGTTLIFSLMSKDFYLHSSDLLSDERLLSVYLWSFLWWAKTSVCLQHSDLLSAQQRLLDTALWSLLWPAKTSVYRSTLLWSFLRWAKTSVYLSTLLWSLLWRAKTSVYLSTLWSFLWPAKISI